MKTIYTHRLIKGFFSNIHAHWLRRTPEEGWRVQLGKPTDSNKQEVFTSHNITVCNNMLVDWLSLMACQPVEVYFMPIG